MSEGKRYVLIFSFILIYFVGKSLQDVKTSNRKERHLFPLLGFLNGYKTAQNYFQYPPYLFPPIIVLPSVTQQQAINIQKSYSDESYQENGGIFQYIQSAKLILNSNRDNNSKASDIDCESDLTDDKDIARQVSVEDDSVKENVAILNSTKPESQINDTVNLTATTNDNSSIPVNNNATDIPTVFILPSNQSHNFSTPSNNTYDNVTTIASLTAATNENDNDFDSEFYEINSNETYPNAWYNNTLVDKIRLTTPYDVKSTSKDDGWYSEASINSVSGFRPLAGLYYDGFLDKPVTKRSGFTPVKSKRVSSFFTFK